MDVVQIFSKNRRIDKSHKQPIPSLPKVGLKEQLSVCLFQPYTLAHKGTRGRTHSGSIVMYGCVNLTAGLSSALFVPPDSPVAEVNSSAQRSRNPQNWLTAGPAWGFDLLF